MVACFPDPHRQLAFLVSAVLSTVQDSTHHTAQFISFKNTIHASLNNHCVIFATVSTKMFVSAL